eukprot:g58208.t1
MKAGGGLTSLFAKEQAFTAAGVDALSYKPKFKPGSERARAKPAATPSSAPAASNLLFAAPVTLISYDSAGAPQVVGTRGFALLQPTAGAGQLVCYEPDTQRQLSIATISTSFILQLQANNYATFSDDSGARWCIQAQPDAIENITRFLALMKHFSHTDDSEAPLLCQDLVLGEGQAVAEEDTLKARYSMHLLADNHPRALGTLVGQVGKDKAKTITLGEDSKQLAGVRRGAVGMLKGGKRLLVLPPSMAYGAASPTPNIPANATLVVEISVEKIKHAKKSKKTEPEPGQLVAVGSAQDAALASLQQQPDSQQGGEAVEPVSAERASSNSNLTDRMAHLSGGFRLPFSAGDPPTNPASVTHSPPRERTASRTGQHAPIGNTMGNGAHVGPAAHDAYTLQQQQQLLQQQLLQQQQLGYAAWPGAPGPVAAPAGLSSERWFILEQKLDQIHQIVGHTAEMQAGRVLVAEDYGQTLTPMQVVQALMRLSAERDRMKELYESSQAKVGELQQRTEELHQRSAAMLEENSRMMEKRYETLREESKHRNQVVLTLQEEKRNLASQLSEAQLSLSNAEFSKSQAVDEYKRRAQVEFQNLKRQLAGLTQQLESAHAAGSHKEEQLKTVMARQIESLQAELAASQGMNADSQTKLTAAQEGTRAAKREVAAARAEASKYSAQVQEKEDEIEELRRQLEDAKANTARFQEEFREMRRQAAESARKLEDAQGRTREAAAVAQDAKEELTRANEKALAEAQAALAADRVQWAEEKTALQRAIADMTTQLAAGEDGTARVRLAAVEAQLREARTQQTELTKQLEQANSHAQQAQQQLAQAQQNNQQTPNTQTKPEGYFALEEIKSLLGDMYKQLILPFPTSQPTPHSSQQVRAVIKNTILTAIAQLAPPGSTQPSSVQPREQPAPPPQRPQEEQQQQQQEQEQQESDREDDWEEDRQEAAKDTGESLAGEGQAGQAAAAAEQAAAGEEEKEEKGGEGQAGKAWGDSPVSPRRPALEDDTAAPAAAANLFANSDGSDEEEEDAFFGANKPQAAQPAPPKQAGQAQQPPPTAQPVDLFGEAADDGGLFGDEDDDEHEGNGLF